MNRTLAACSAMLFLSTLPALAEDFRCPNGKIVSTGDSISIVAIKCDPPASIVKREEPYQTTVGARIIYIEVQEWTYTQGSTLLHTLVFRNGQLSEVRTGGFSR